MNHQRGEGAAVGKMESKMKPQRIGTKNMQIVWVGKGDSSR